MCFYVVSGSLGSTVFQTVAFGFRWRRLQLASWSPSLAAPWTMVQMNLFGKEVEEALIFVLQNFF